MNTQTLEALRLAGLDPASLPDLESMVPGAANLVERGGELSDWQKERLGKITCSQFYRVTRGRGGNGWSQTAQTYMDELVGEWLTGEPASNFSSKATDWGNEWEAEAIDLYERKTRRRVERGKFYKAAGFQLVGGTPDGVGNIGFEVKCPITPTNHVRTLESGEVPDLYYPQVMGHMLVTGRKKCAFVSYHPKMKRREHRLVVVDVLRNEHEIKELSDRLTEFEEALIKRLDRLGVDWREKKH